MQYHANSFTVYLNGFELENGLTMSMKRRPFRFLLVYEKQSKQKKFTNAARK